MLTCIDQFCIEHCKVSFAVWSIWDNIQLEEKPLLLWSDALQLCGFESWCRSAREKAGVMTHKEEVQQSCINDWCQWKCLWTWMVLYHWKAVYGDTVSHLSFVLINSPVWSLVMELGNFSWAEYCREEQFVLPMWSKDNRSSEKMLFPSFIPIWTFGWVISNQ